MKRHILKAVLYEKPKKNETPVVINTIEEEFFSIYNLENRKFDLEDKDYKCETIRVAA